MRNFKLTIEYDGGRYAGWQRLGRDESSNTIENKITDVLCKMLNHPVELFAGMRTEKGVHAYGQVANFKCETDVSCMDIMHYLNRYLPRDIAVTSVVEMPERFHASLNAKSKTFVYRIDANDVPDVFERNYRYYVFKKPDVKLMQEACSILCGTHDFAKFTSARKNKSTIKNILDAKVLDDGCELQIVVKANDFMHNMARYIFGCLLMIGSGELTINQFKDFLDGESDAGPEKMADTCGMFLLDIEY